MLAWYWAGAVTVAAVVAALRPWAVSRGRGALVGFLASFPLSLAFNFVFLPQPLSGTKLAIYLLLLGVTMGMPIGAMYWSRE
jgi:hypothetical protein